MASDISEFHPWDPHKAAKDVEVGDYYFKRKNYAVPKIATARRCSTKTTTRSPRSVWRCAWKKWIVPDDARKEYESYLRILPHGPQAEEARRQSSG